jgi:hypothetical protein
LELPGVAASEESIGTLPEIDAFLPQAVSQPVMLIEADSGRKGQIGTHPNEHPPPVPVVDVEVVLHDPALSQLQMPALLCPDGNQDPGRFPGFEYHHYLISFGVLKVRIDKVIPSSLRGLQNGRVPFLAAVLDPVLKLLGDIAQAVASNPLALPIGIEEADHSFGLLKRLDQPVQKNPIETTVAKFDAILMVFAEGVHRLLQVVRYQELTALNASATLTITGYQGRSPWLSRNWWWNMLGGNELEVEGAGFLSKPFNTM